MEKQKKAILYEFEPDFELVFGLLIFVKTKTEKKNEYN
jgi:hypothetical protein